MIRELAKKFVQRKDDWSDARHVRSLRREPPELVWKVGPRCPQRRVEGGRVQLGHELYVLGGYITIGSVAQSIDVLDLETRKWTKRFTLPPGVPQTHCGWTTSGDRYIFAVAGQLGANCAPAVANCFAWDTRADQWTELPSLPAARYMSLVHFHDGRIHVFGGSKGDRQTAAKDHWSLGVEEGRAGEDRWRAEEPMQSGRTHTATQLFGDKVYVFGGQQGDVTPVAGDPEYRCDWGCLTDELFDEVSAFDLKSGKWETLAPMPYKVSHTEHATVQVGNQVLIVGGVLNRQTMFDVILAYDLANDEWQEIGHLPYPMKSKIVAHHDGWLILATGQRSISQSDLRPGKVLDSVWMARLQLRE